MDVFAFAFHSATHEITLTDALAAGVPIVALDAPGVDDIVRDQVNGRLLRGEIADEFASAFAWIAGLTQEGKAGYSMRSERPRKSFRWPGQLA